MIRVALDSEIQGIGAYTITGKRLDVHRLVDDVGALFAPGVFGVLPEIARYDFQEAGKCIAFERPTAAAFHCLRATEAVLRLYYQQLVRQKRVGSLNWGHIVVDLRARKKPKQTPY